MRGPIVRLLEAGFYENFIETAGEVTPELDDVSRELHNGGASMVMRSSPTGGSNDLKRLYLLAIASARRTHRHHLAVLRHRRIERLGAPRRRVARRQGPHPRRRRHHRRDGR